MWSAIKPFSCHISQTVKCTKLLGRKFAKKKIFMFEATRNCILCSIFQRKSALWSAKYVVIVMIEL
jgi:hypothetical protein